MSEELVGSSVAEVCRLEVVVVDGGVDVALVAQKVQRLETEEMNWKCRISVSECV